jgi:hypothetical protein
LKAWGIYKNTINLTWLTRGNYHLLLFIKRNFITYLILFIFIFLAWSHSWQLMDDSYLHFQSSVNLWKNHLWKDAIIDIWNKPIPILLYGGIGQWGIFFSRLISILLTFATCNILARIIEKIFPLSGANPRLLSFYFFFCQLNVMPQSFLTMTELPAAFLLTVGIYFFLTNRIFWCFFIWGLMPLARVECSLIMVVGFCIISITTFFCSGRDLRVWKQVFLLNLVGALPFLSWILLGGYVTGDYQWLWKNSYGWLRTSCLGDWLAINAIIALPNHLSVPLLLGFLMGIWHLPKQVEPKLTSRSTFILTLYAMLLIHFIFLSSVNVYPATDFPGISGVAAINGRNFNVLAPLFMIFITAGYVHLGVILRRPSLELKWKDLIWQMVLPLQFLIGMFFCFLQSSNVQYPLWRAILKCARLEILLIICFFIIVWFRKKQAQLPMAWWRNYWAIWSLYVLLALLLTQPFFWYPTQSLDHRSISHKAFCDWYRGTNTIVPRIIQDMNGSLASFCGIETGNADWVWPKQFATEFNQSKPGSLIVFETESQGNIDPRYGNNLLNWLPKNSHIIQVGQFAFPPEKNRLTYLLNRISNKNCVYGWKVYEKIDNLELAPLP